VAERGTAGIVVPGAGPGRFLREVHVGRCENMDLSCASGSGSTFSRARRGDRTIGTWPPSFCAPSRLGSRVVIGQRDALDPANMAKTDTGGECLELLAHY
jgi:hypothetical protein